MPHPAERRVARISADASWLVERLPKALRALALLTPDGFPVGGQDGGRATSHADPAGEAAVAGLDTRSAYARIDALSAESAGVLGELVDAVERVIDPGIDTETIWSQHRCTGGEGDWGDPTCERLAVRNVEVDRGRKLPLCWACRKRFQRWRWAQAAQAS